jgi:hypothetical protein
MMMKRLAAAAAAASLAAMAFVATASPANAWDLALCKKTWASGHDHPDCEKFKTTTTMKHEKPTTTVKGEEATTTTTAKATTSTTTAVKGESTKPTPVVVKPKFTG